MHPIPASKKPSTFAELRVIRHPIRVAVMMTAAIALTWSLVGVRGALTSGLAAGSGVLLGEWIGKSRLKLSAVFTGSAAALLFFWGLASMITSTEFFADLVGPGAALGISVIVRFAAFTLFPVLALRALAVRKPSTIAVELAFVVGAIAVLFSAHRGGVVARPLWLSDWAWRAGIDPAHVFLAIGAGTVLTLTVLMVAETGRRISWLSVFAAPALALIVLSFMDLSGLPKPNAENDLGLTERSDKETNKTQNKGRPDKGPQSKGSAAPKPEGSGNTGPRPERKDGDGSDDSKDGEQDSENKDDGDGAQSNEDQDSESDGESSQPPAPVAVLLLHDDYFPPTQSYYLRQEVLSHYTGSRLVAARRSGVDLDAMTEFPTREVSVHEPPPKDVREKITADVVLLVEHTAPFGLEAPVTFSPRGNPNPERFVRSYTVSSMVLKVGFDKMVGRKAGNPKWGDDVREYYLKTSSDRRFAELAQKIVDELPEEKRADPFLKAAAVKLWMDKELTYSTKERHANVPDPTADFLFGNRIGYCVHFAHAAVYMWRSLGIPARAGTGYAVRDDARQGSSLIVQTADAHAWPEIYLEGMGWVVLDIAPERNLDQGVPGADKELQKSLAEMARNKPPVTEEPGDDRKSRTILPPFWLVLGIMLGVAMVVLYIIKLWRRIVPAFARPRALTRVGYRLALDLLGEVGLIREYGETRESFARRIDNMVPSFSELTRMHLAARWSDPSVAMDERSEFEPKRWKKGLAKLRKERRTVTTTPKRLMNVLNPASFVWSR